MSLFANLSTNGLEESTDRLGGFQPLDSDIYTGKIKLAYAIISSGGAKGVALTIQFGDKEFRTTQYITNKKGENFFLNKQDNSKKVPLPGFTIVDDLCLCATGKPLCEQDAEDKMVSIYDADLKKEVPKSVPVLTELLNQEVSLAILRTLVNKNAKDSAGEYQPTAQTREENEVVKVFNSEARLTVAEARAGETTPKFWDAWLERNKGKTQDKTKDVVAGAAGKPAVMPQAGSQPARTSLFGKK